MFLSMNMQHIVILCMLCVVILTCSVQAQEWTEERVGEEMVGEDDIVREIQREIVTITKSTKESKRKANVESYEKIFLRLAAVGFTAVGRNMLYASTQTVFQGDDDEEEESDKRELNIEAVNIIESWMDDSELEDTGRSQLVPQILGEPLFYVPASYWLQV